MFLIKITFPKSIFWCICLVGHRRRQIPYLCNENLKRQSCYRSKACFRRTHDNRVPVEINLCHLPYRFTTTANTDDPQHLRPFPGSIQCRSIFQSTIQTYRLHSHNNYIYIRRYYPFLNLFTKYVKCM